MRIFLISNMYPSDLQPHYGTFVSDFKTDLEKQGAIFTRLSLIKGRGANVFEKVFKYTVFYYSIIKNFFSYDYDLIYIHYPTVVLPIFSFLFPFAKCKIVLNYHGDDLIPRTLLHSILLGLTRKTVIRCSGFVFPSYFFMKTFLSKFRVPDYSCHVNYSGGVDLQCFVSSAIKNESVMRIGFVSRIEESKGYKLLIKSMLLLRDMNIRFHVTFIGGGSELNNLQETLSLNFSKDLFAVLGPLNRSLLPLYFSKFDLFVFPTLLPESLGLVALESLASGVPVIAFDVGAVSEYIVDGYNGFLISKTDHVGIANAILIYNSLSSYEIERLRVNARESAMRFDSKRLACELFYFLSNV